MAAAGLNLRPKRDAVLALGAAAGKSFIEMKLEIALEIGGVGHDGSGNVINVLTAPVEFHIGLRRINNTGKRGVAADINFRSVNRRGCTLWRPAPGS